MVKPKLGSKTSLFPLERSYQLSTLQTEVGKERTDLVSKRCLHSIAFLPFHGELEWIISLSEFFRWLKPKLSKNVNHLEWRCFCKSLPTFPRFSVAVRNFCLGSIVLTQMGDGKDPWGPGVCSTQRAAEDSAVQLPLRSSQHSETSLDWHLAWIEKYLGVY